MNDVITEMANYICDQICQKPKEITDREKLEDYCNGECEFPTYLCRLVNQQEKYKSITLCEECAWRAYEKETGAHWCRLSGGLDSCLKENEGCSRGTTKHGLEER